MIHKKATLLDKILIVLLILSILVGLAVSSDYSDKVDNLQAEIEHLTEVVDATQQTADNWQEKYNDVSRELASLERQIRDQEVLDAQVDQFEDYVSNSDKSIEERLDELRESGEQSEQIVNGVSPTPEPTPQPTPEPQTSVTVYITNTGEKYHRWGCQYLWNSSIAVALDYALASGYTPCSRCNPPRG